jgi:FtsP/CotA-like multicopper oxidase with cupredoxin domain
MFSRRFLRHFSRAELHSMSRRELLKLGLIASGSAFLPVRGARADGGDDLHSPPVTPFLRDLPVPPVLQPVNAFTVGPAAPQCSSDVPGFDLSPPVLYQVPMRESEQEIIPGKLTRIWGYTGTYPGPTIRVDRNHPVVVRFVNELDVDTSIHNHGGTTPAESDGFPNDFIFPGEFKDYCYPNIADEDQTSEFTTTQWYHDHAMDITGENVYMGLAGFYLLSDDLEKDLIASGVLPAGQYDIPVVLQDRLFADDGSLIYDPMDHDGVIGDRFLANGVIQPRFTVQRRRYRFRILNGSNARVYGLRLSTGQPFLQIGADSWLLPKAVLRTEMALGPAERADVVIDFTNAPANVFLTNHLTYELDGGRKPEEDFDDPKDWTKTGVPLLKFIVAGAGGNDATVAPGTPLRPHVKILASEIVKSRTFKFDRSHGAWTINGKFFDPDRDDAAPRVGTAEKWTIQNSSGGWVHPIHLHLEPMQIQKIDGKGPPPWQAGKKDTILLGDFSATFFVKFHSFTGRYVFHCHNVEHEDMRMMGTFNVRP